MKIWVDPSENLLEQLHLVTATSLRAHPFVPLPHISREALSQFSVIDQGSAYPGFASICIAIRGVAKFRD